MINRVINIDIDYESMGVEPSPRQTTLTTYILDDRNIVGSTVKKRPAVIVCPGGGYERTSEREAEPIAMKYCAAGYHAFVLDYSVKPSGFPAQITELSKAIMYVKSIANENNIDRDRVFVCGFSAGGHLAASIGVHYNHPDVVKFSDAKNEENKPAGIILSYPVITGEVEKSHQGTIDIFTANRHDVEKLSYLENYVTEDTPKMFIWHTFEDQLVPVISSLRMANALESNNVEFELHIYPTGLHGLALANNVTEYWEGNVNKAAQTWMDMSIRWIADFK